MAFPIQRLRRLRQHEAFRRMVRETRLSVSDLIYPLFVTRQLGEEVDVFLAHGAPAARPHRLASLFGKPVEAMQDDRLSHAVPLSQSGASQASGMAAACAFLLSGSGRAGPH